MDVGFGLPTVVDLKGMGVGPNPISILRQHDSNRVVGHSDRVTTDDRSLTVEGRVSGTGPHVDEILKTADPKRDPKDRFPWQVSIGAKVIRAAFLDEQEEVDVNGRKIVGPAIIVRESLLTEVSFVPIGADTSTSASIAASGGSSSLVSLEFDPMTFSEWLKAQGFEEATLNEVIKKTLKAMYDKAMKASAEIEPETTEEEGDDEPTTQRRRLPVIRAAAGDDEPEEDEDEEEDTAVEPRRRRKKRRQIQASGARQDMRDFFAELKADFHKEVTAEQTRQAAINAIPGISPQLAAQAISSKWSALQAELEHLRAGRGQSVPAIHMKDRSQISGQAIEAAMAMSVGASPESLKPNAVRRQAGYTDQIIDQAMSAEYRGFGIQTLFYEVIRAAGMNVRPGLVNEEFIDTGFRADKALRAAGMATISLTGILGNVANKILISAYDSVATVWQHFCAIGSNPDFKVGTRYRLDSTGAMKKIGMDGKIHSAGLAEAGYTSQLDTYAVMLKLPRTLIYNDDLNSFALIPQQLGRMGSLRREEAFFVLVLSNANNFFHTNNKNLLTGSGSALAIAGLTGSSTAFLKMTDSNGKPILSNPNRLLVPTALAVTADNLYTSLTLSESSGAGNTLGGVDNPHRSKYKAHPSGYLDNTAIRDQDGKALSGQSATAWYQFADPAQLAAFRMSFLNGQQTPMVSAAEGGFDELAVQWRIVDDFVASQEDPAGAVKNNGA